MSIASTAAKQRWNKAHYAEIKASLKKGLVEQFKAKCKEDGVSIASVFAVYMSDYCGIKPSQKKNEKKFQYDTLPKRRKIAKTISGQLDEMLQYEMGYRERIPENLADGIRAESADQRIENLNEALDLIREAY